MSEKLHPKIDSGLPKEKSDLSGRTLVCACTSNPVKVKIKGQIAKDHFGLVIL
jgi:S-(hydroxymethyl)glutathione synthase